jgi:beta-glucosidase
MPYIYCASGVTHYRFSIMWNRILPCGTVSGVGSCALNQAAIDYYNDLINTLLRYGVAPHVTIYHSEMPLALTMYPYMSNPMLDQDRFVPWFTDYAEVLFAHFGDRVQQWFTFNEPFCFSVYGVYGGEDPYTIAHNTILAHASVVNLYRSKYQPAQKGVIGIVLNTAHFYPADAGSAEDEQLAQRGYDFWYGWFLDPLTRGEYPASMRQTLGSRLPAFTREQKKRYITYMAYAMFAGPGST